MASRREQELFEDYLKGKNLRHSNERRDIVAAFLDIDKHLTADELYRTVKEKHPNLGYATVYRTLKLLCESGLCREVKFDDGLTRYEHLYGHGHHDHLICTKCGKFVEVMDPGIERLQEKLFEKHGFHPQRHGMLLYGICKACRR